MKSHWLTGAAFSAALAVVAWSLPATAADKAAEFYKGKTIKIVFGFGVGGTYGQYSQLIAQYLEPRLGVAKVITQSMPGGGGLKATNFIYNVAPKDGATLFMPPDTLVVSQLVEPRAAKYKSDGFTWIGAVAQSNALLVVRADSGIATVDDLKTKQIAMASTGRGSQTFLVPQLLNGLLGTKMKIVSGYEGSAKAQLAMEQNEVHGISLTWMSWKTQRAAWFANGFAKPVVQLGINREPELPDVPMLTDMLQGEDRQIADLVATMGPIGRSIVAPPRIPADRAAFLRKAFGEMLADPEFVAEAEKRKLRVQGSGAEDLEKIVSNALKIPPKTVERARRVIIGKTS